MSLSTVTTKGQVTIPKDIRESMAIDAGDKIEFIINAQNDVVIKPITKKAIDIFGQLSQYKKDKPLSIEEMNEAITTQCKKEFS
ncbi:transcriptional regulator, AbrB family [methanotrophic endosymbiont of Bathymodiolus azoricus (Menez Gwen)]|jgi:AbrB family looped-hinge helix DNA binding protein|nr:transcriptional regulator, AbrB family [methanotrophic endosymbiont of Bathymodiolus azoricus (Menez Gwen)]